MHTEISVDGRRQTTQEWRSRDPFLRRRGWLCSFTDWRRLLMSVFGEPSVWCRGWWEKLDPDKRSVEEMNGVYHAAAAVLSRSNQMNNQDKRCGWRGISCLSHFPNSNQIPTWSPWFLARNHHQWRLRSHTNSLDVSPWWEKRGLHHLTGVLWAQLWLKPTGLTQFGTNQDGMVGKTERHGERHPHL